MPSDLDTCNTRHGTTIGSDRDSSHRIVVPWGLQGDDHFPPLGQIERKENLADHRWWYFVHLLVTWPPSSWRRVRFAPYVGMAAQAHVLMYRNTHSNIAPNQLSLSPRGPPRKEKALTASWTALRRCAGRACVFQFPKTKKKNWALSIFFIIISCIRIYRLQYRVS